MIRKKRISEYSYIRASDVHREIMYYEVLDKDDNLLMTISPDPEGHYDVYFEKLRGGRVIRLDLLKEILAKMETSLDEDGDWNDDEWGIKEKPANEN